MVVWQDVWLDGASNVFCESNDRSNLSLLKFIISLTTRFYLIHFSPASVLPSWLIDSETYISSSTTTESTYHFFPFALICIPTLILLMLCFSNCFAVQSCIKVAEKPVQRMHWWVEPPSDGVKHCSSWWVSLSFKRFLSTCCQRSHHDPSYATWTDPSPKTVSSGCRPEQHSSACLSVGATCRWQTRWWYHQNHEEAMWWRHCCQYKLLGVAAAIGTK